MSLYAYIVSRDLGKYEFYALLMAAMRNADTRNIAILKRGFPEVWAELDARYHAPGGLLEGEEGAITSLPETE
jgi:hypothetical protein